MFFSQVAPALADTITVTTDVDALDANDGLCSLREAAIASNTDSASGAVAGECNAGNGADTILLPSGTYTLTIAGAYEDMSESGDIDLLADTILSGTGASSTVINANGIDRVFDIDPTYTGITVTLSGLTMRNGIADGDNGGALIQHTGSLTLFQVSVISNTADRGGGLYLEGGSLAVTHASITGNTATSRGGGFYSSGEHFALSDTLVRDNIASSMGGGIAVNSGSYAITRTVIVRNSAYEGGGFFSDGLGGSMENVILSANHAIQDAGGLQHSSGRLSLNNVTLTDNVADADHDGIGSGGGLYIYYAPLQFNNTLIARNRDDGSAPDCLTPSNNTYFLSTGHNLIGSTAGCTLTGTLTGNLTDLDAQLASLVYAANTPLPYQPLLRTSPARDAGDPATCAASDVRGVTRPQGPACDIGAFENEPARGSLSGSVYIDVNANGTRDAGEAGIADVQVTASGPQTLTTWTAFDGSFGFANLLTGTYSPMVLS